jgi:cold-inducible RNA-binding protein
VPAVRLFIGNLPYTATEEDIRSHFATVAPPTQVVRPLDRETGRARGFAFVEYGERTHAEEAIKRFDGQLFMGRPLAVSEARAREDRGPSGPRPGGSFGAPRPGGMGGPGSGPPRPGGYSPRPPGEGGYAGRPGGGYRSNPGDPPLTDAAIARQRNFGPPAPPKGKKGPKAGFASKERGPRGPIPTKFTGRVYGLDDEAEAGAGGDDALPDFMKADADAGTDTDATASTGVGADAGGDAGGDTDDGGDDKE